MIIIKKTCSMKFVETAKFSKSETKKEYMSQQTAEDKSSEDDKEGITECYASTSLFRSKI